MHKPLENKADYAVLKALKRDSRRGLALDQLIRVATRRGLSKAKVVQAVKTLEEQRRIKIVPNPTVYRGENYYFWHESLD